MNKHEDAIRVLAVIPTIFPDDRLLEICDELKNGTPWISSDILVVYNEPTRLDFKHPDPQPTFQSQNLTDLAEVFYPRVNMNWLHSCNMGLLRGVREKYSHVLLLNDDVRLSGEFLEEMIISATKPDVYQVTGHSFGITAPMYNGFWGEKQREVPWKGLHNRRPEYHVHYVDGTCMLVSTELVEKIGVLDSSFGSPGWGADVDYCFRARQADALIGVCPQAYVWHDKQIGGTSAEKVYGSAKNWHVRGLRQARNDLKAKYGSGFRKTLGLPQGAYIETARGIEDVEKLRQSP